MKNKGFTLIEMLAVVAILAIIGTIVIVKVEKTSKNSAESINEEIINNIEAAALIYANTYYEKLGNLDRINVDVITIQDLIDSGLIKRKNINDINATDKILIADINNVYKIKYTKTDVPVIFVNGTTEISIYKGKDYEELGAVVAKPNEGVIELNNSNITSNVNNNIVGKYEVLYSYSGADSVKRIVNVISN